MKTKRRRSIVGEEQYDCIFQHIIFPQRLENLANAFVKFGNHGSVNSSVGAVDVIEFPYVV
jgi:hypothetical protein